MMDSTQDISSPAYFEKTFGVPAAQAETLSAQAKAASVNRGGGITAVPPPGPQVSASPAPGAVPLAAQAEYAQLMADRASGKITTAQWHNGGSAREQELANLIANGGGAQPAPLVTPAAETHPYLGAPPSPGDYGLLHGVGDIPEEQVAEISAQQDAFARLNLNQSVVQDVNARLRTMAAELASAAPDVVQARVEANYSRFNAQCAKEGITPAQAESLIGAQLKAWSTAEPAVRVILENIVKIGDPTMLDYILQIAKHQGIPK
jgi:hypothetical protein